MIRPVKKFFLWAVVAVLLSIWGCARYPGVVERPKPLSNEEWVARLKDRAEYWQTYQATLHLRADSAKGKYPLRAVILANLPGQFRLEAFNLWGQTLGVLILNNDQSTLWVPNERTIYTAQKPGVLTDHFLGVSLPLDILGYSLAACLPPAELKTFKMVAGSSKWIGMSRGIENGWSYQWEFLSQPMALKAFEAREGLWHYSVTYEPSVPLDVKGSPQRVKFLSSEWQMDITLDQIQVTSILQSDLFLPVFPGETRKVNLDASK